MIKVPAQIHGADVRTAYKWLHRYRVEVVAGMQDHSSRSCHCLMWSLRRDKVIDQFLDQIGRQIANQLTVGPSPIATFVRYGAIDHLPPWLSAPG